MIIELANGTVEEVAIDCDVELVFSLLAIS